jgi:protein TonB
VPFRDRRAPALSASLALHVALFAALLLAMRHAAPATGSTSNAPDRAMPRMVWLNAAGPGGGGGGGGNRMKDPPRPAERQGRDALTVPAARPRAADFSRPATAEPPALPSLVIPVASLASATDALPQIGAIGAPPGLTLSQGPGDGDGAGTGHGPGDGPGRGVGLGDGRDRGTGGDAYRPGNDVTMPIEIRRGTPRYTSEAMRARAQGAILVECVVQTTGICDRIHVVRSFDPAFGLDQEAINAAAQWRFRPGTRRGEPVPVIVTMEIAFALR